MKRFAFLVFTLAAALVVGCGGGGGGRRGGSDAGSEGGIVLMDGGGRTDSGGGGTDAGPRDSGGGTTCTTDMPLPRTISPFPGSPPCAASTAMCLSSCMDAACQDACFMADPAPMDCQQCFFINLYACVNSMGCADEWTSLACCVNTTCPTDTMLSCANPGQPCADENSGWETCANGVAAGCNASVGACFMAM